MNASKIGKVIRTRRVLLKIRQEDLAEMSGVALKTIHFVETGTGNPSLATLIKIADIIGLEILIQVKTLNNGEGGSIL